MILLNKKFEMGIQNWVKHFRNQWPFPNLLYYHDVEHFHHVTSICQVDLKT